MAVLDPVVRVRAILLKAAAVPGDPDFEEEEHPREGTGKFTSGGGSSDAPKDEKPSAKPDAPTKTAKPKVKKAAPAAPSAAPAVAAPAAPAAPAPVAAPIEHAVDIGAMMKENPKEFPDAEAARQWGVKYYGWKDTGPLPTAKPAAAPAPAAPVAAPAAVAAPVPAAPVAPQPVAEPEPNSPSAGEAGPIARQANRVMQVMRPDEQQALVAGHAAAQAKGYGGSVEDFFIQQAALYQHAEEADPRLATFFYGDTLTRVAQSPEIRAQVEQVAATQKAPQLRSFRLTSTYRERLKVIVLGDLPGHPFYGNQHTGAGGGRTMAAPDKGGGGGGGGTGSREEGQHHHGIEDRPTPEEAKAAALKHKELKTKATDLNIEIQKLINNGEGRSERALALGKEIRDLRKQSHRLNADPGGFSDIGLPGGPRDVLVIGGGPAGLEAAVSAGYEGYDTLVVEASDKFGGQSGLSSRIENKGGYALGARGEVIAGDLLDQAQRLGAETQTGVRVQSIEHDPETGLHKVTMSNGKVEYARSVIVATGVEFKQPDFPGHDHPKVGVVRGDKLEEDTKGGHAVVLGGSNGAGQAVAGLIGKAKKVTLIIRGKLDTMSAEPREMVERLIETGPQHGTVVEVIQDEVKAVHDRDGKPVVTTKEGREIPADGVGVYWGGKPNLSFLPEKVRPRPGDTIVTNDNQMTDIPGLFVAGDAREHHQRGRVSGAAGDGSGAVIGLYPYFQSVKKEIAERPARQAAIDKQVQEAADRAASAGSKKSSSPWASAPGGPGSGKGPGRRHRAMVMSMDLADDITPRRPRPTGKEREELLRRSDTSIDQMFELDWNNPWLRLLEDDSPLPPLLTKRQMERERLSRPRNLSSSPWVNHYRDALHMSANPVPVSLGDLPGHTFRGNQYSDAPDSGGGGGSSTPTSSATGSGTKTGSGSKTRAEKTKEEHDALVSDLTTRPPAPKQIALDPPAPPCEGTPCHPIADIVEKSIEPLGGGINGTYTVKSEVDSKPVEAVYKPESEQKRDIAIERNNYNEASVTEREAAAYDVDQALGLGITPQTDLTPRSLSRGEGSVQHKIDAPDGGMASLNEIMKVPDSEWYKMGVLDTVLGNPDRHSGNYLVKNGRVYAIDHGYAFPKTDDTTGGSGNALKEDSLPDDERKELVRRLRETDWEKATQGRLRGKTLEALKARAKKTADAIEKKDLRNITW